MPEDSCHSVTRLSALRSDTGGPTPTRAIAHLATQLATAEARVIAPNLGWLDTWLAFAPC
ncbi:MAG: hypothetical protein HC838_02865 [Spirulinaceae cyanobacterium RM2_2_10]|nr:hypothetical protein [Spirulinaceae cyanobacterium RM2_2_10]